MFFKKILLFFIRFFSVVLYKLLPATVCSRLESSRPAKFLSNIVSSKEAAIYSLKYGIRLKLTRDEVMQGFLHLGELNPIETAIVRKNFVEGGVFFDVGAFVDGWYTILASKIAGDQGKVFAFEPIPDSFEKLKVNVALNDCQNVVVEKYAVSDTAKKQKIVVSGSTSSLKRDEGDEDVEAITVDVVTLDEYVDKNKIDRVDFIKIDVEGVEGLVLAGAARTIQKFKPMMLVEVVDRHLAKFNTNSKEIISTICEFGYEAYVIKTHGPVKYDEKNCISTTPNMFFVPQG